MGYDLKAKNKALEDFYFGAFSFPIVLSCGILSNSSIHSSELQPGKIIHFKSENIASIWAE